ncbi:uncharacterized protein LOC107874482 [Capsicum annuum]|uniref:uncharacterized protein LOC107874482 n=1 Tax=Capsicum annuum TaxID=4072 RepID=UPI0007BF0E61|nr:uncharacterized protein LOC107874482 [Capsicum annuum]
MDNKVIENKDDPRAFTIPCRIGTHEFKKALCDLGASINRMHFVIYKKLRLDTPTSSSMQIFMEDWSILRMVGILFDILVKVDKFILPANFAVVDYKMDKDVPIILVRLSIDTGRDIIDLEIGEMKFSVQMDEVFFKICKSRKKTTELQVISVVDVENEKRNKKEFEYPP